MNEKVAVSTTYAMDCFCSIVVPDQEAVRNVLNIVGNACGASAQQVQALLLAMEVVALKEDGAWRWDDWYVEQAHKWGIYTPDIAWADGLDYTCSRVGDRVHISNIRYDGQPFPYTLFGEHYGIPNETPIIGSTIHLTSCMKSNESDEIILPVAPLLKVIREFLRKPCIPLTESQIEAEEQKWHMRPGDCHPLETIETDWTFAERLVSACQENRYLEVCEDDELYKPQYPSLNRDDVSLKLQFQLEEEGAIDWIDDEPPLTSIDTFGGTLYIPISKWRAKLEITLDAKRPYEAVHNAKIRELTEWWASSLKREYEAYDFCE